MKTPISLEIIKVYLNTGVFEGYEYYNVTAETAEGITLKKKLTAFEYKMLKDMYGEFNGL